LVLDERGSAFFLKMNSADFYGKKPFELDKHKRIDNNNKTNSASVYY